jgi:hypothetical protein
MAASSAGFQTSTPYELILQLENIEHCTWFETIDQMQKVLDDYLVTYNTKSPEQGRGMNGTTPIAAFIAGPPKPTIQNPTDKKQEAPPHKPANNSQPNPSRRGESQVTTVLVHVLRFKFETALQVTN